MTLSRYSGPRRSPPALRMLDLEGAPASGVSSPESATGSGSGGGLPTGKTSRYSGPVRSDSTLHMLSLFPPPPIEVSLDTDPLQIIL